MACSFRYFLYLNAAQGLTGLNTTSKKFFAAAEDAHPEAFAPLLLLAICGRDENTCSRARSTSAAEMSTSSSNTGVRRGVRWRCTGHVARRRPVQKRILVEWRYPTPRASGRPQRSRKYCLTARRSSADKNTRPAPRPAASPA